MRSIEIRLSVLKELRRFLLQFSGDIVAKSAEFNLRVIQLREVGISVQIADNYIANYASQNFQYLKNIVANITDVDLPHINARIAKLEQSVIWRDTRGNIVAKKIGNRILDVYGNWLYEIRGDRVYDVCGNWKYELRYDRVYDTAGNWRYELRGNRIYDTAGNWLAYEY